MTKKLTITVSDEVYEGLHRRLGKRKISRFIDDLARRHVLTPGSAEFWLNASQEDLNRAYAEQAAYEKEHADEIAGADEDWLNGLIGDTLQPDRTNETG